MVVLKCFVQSKGKELMRQVVLVLILGFDGLGFCFLGPIQILLFHLILSVERRINLFGTCLVLL